MSSRPWRTGGAVELAVPAEPLAVYEVIADVARIGERSPECWSASWEQGAPGEVGSVFRGRNRWGRFARWSRRCEVTQATPGQAFAFRTLPERWDLSRRDSTTWRYSLVPVDGGTRVQHSYEITMLPLRPMRSLYGRLLPQHLDMRPQMQDNLERLREHLGGGWTD